MLQQTGVKTVGPYFRSFWRAGRMSTRSAARSLDDVLRMWAGLGYYSRARAICMPARSRCCATMAACFPTPRKACARCRGSGPIRRRRSRAIAFDRRTMPVDGNIERVVSRLFAVGGTAAAGQAADPATGGDAWLDAGDEVRAGDSAQALMDLGSSICTPKKPACALCPLNEDCAARARGDQETFPRKAPKKTGALRAAARAFVVTRGDELAGSHAPEKGLLGGMTEVPGLGLAGRAGRQGGARSRRRRLRATCAGIARPASSPTSSRISAGACGLHRKRCRARTRRRRACAGCRSQRSPAKRCRMSCARRSRTGSDLVARQPEAC